MDDDHRRGTGSLRLPVAMAKYLNISFDVDQSFLRRTHLVSPREEVAGDSLGVWSDERATRHEGLTEEIVGAGGLSFAQGVRNSVQFFAHGAIGGSTGFGGLHL